MKKVPGENYFIITDMKMLNRLVNPPNTLKISYNYKYLQKIVLIPPYKCNLYIYINCLNLIM